MVVSAHLIHLGAGEGCELTTVGSGTPSSEDFDLFSAEPQGAIKLGILESVKGRQSPAVTPGPPAAQQGSTLLCPNPLLYPDSSGFPSWLRTRKWGSSAFEKLPQGSAQVFFGTLISPPQFTHTHQYICMHIYI